MIRISQPYLGEEELEAVREVFRSGHLAQGPRVKQLEERFAESVGTEHAVAVSTGTAAIHASLLSHGVSPGDEVITSGLTFASPVNCILFCGAKPVFADIGEDFNIAPSDIESKVTEKTRAIMPTHLYGQPADMKHISEIAERHGLAVIEDACQAHGAEFSGRKVGSFGTGCFSFYATKNITSGEGGIITTDDKDVAERARLLRSHGMARRYEHSMVGYNYRMSDIQAAILLAQLPRLDGFNDKRIRNAGLLTKGLGEAVIAPREFPGRKHVFHAYTARLPEGCSRSRDDVIRELGKMGIESIAYYPKPVYSQGAYAGLPWSGAGLPATDAAAGSVFSLPVHPGLEESDIDRVVAAVRECAR
jgi:dTDP-4-amino-4,6-dideoxygalactose transaminase